ncbi:MAG: hypothetical protein ACLQIQ_06710 [Beijerinckiaceae bacterium]
MAKARRRIIETAVVVAPSVEELPRLTAHPQKCRLTEARSASPVTASAHPM